MAKRKSKSAKRPAASSASSKMSSSSMGCSSCHSGGCGSCRCWGWILALVGVIFLLQDLGMLARWGLNWPLNWWTVAALLVGAKWLMKR